MIWILPPWCISNVRSRTPSTVTPSTWRTAPGRCGSRTRIVMLKGAEGCIVVSVPAPQPGADVRAPESTWMGVGLCAAETATIERNAHKSRRARRPRVSYVHGGADGKDRRRHARRFGYGAAH